MELIESGFIEKYQSLVSKSKMTRYRIFDEFCLFHLQFMAKYKGNSWKQLYTKPLYKTWSVYAFEMICYKHVESIKSALKCDQIESRNYSWNNKKAQVDLVLDRNDNTFNLCEIKFYNDEFTIDSEYAAQLRKKETQYQSDTKTKKGIHTVMMTTWGTKGKHGVGLVTKNLTMDCLFQ